MADGRPAGWPSIATVPAGVPFVDALARWLAIQASPADAGRAADAVAPDPLSLSRMRVLLPARRAVRALREAFLRLSDGRPWILPELRAIGDPDEAMLGLLGEAVSGGGASLDLPPAIEPARRQAVLARLVLAREPSLGPEQALRLAGDLARLVDEVTRERLDFARLPDLVADRELAAHWQETVRFLTIVTQAWPTLRAAEGALDPADRLDRLLAAQATLWRDQPPADPVVVAGLASASPAVADLLEVVATLPRGLILLPGLDRDLDPASWDGLDDTHPQAGMKRLLAGLGVERAEVPDLHVAWDGPRWPGALPQRRALVREVMRPAETSDAWRRLTGLHQPALAGLQRLDCASPREEAESIALMLREVLETAARTAAVITPDRRLARMIAAALTRWGLVIDDSGGRGLGDLPAGTYLRLLARATVPTAGPVDWLALFKHPLAAAGRDRAAFQRAVRTLDTAMRGPRPAPGLDGLRRAVASARGLSPTGRAAVSAMLAGVEACLGPCLAAMGAAVPVAADRLLDIQMRAAEALAATDGLPGPMRLWRGDDGEAAARLAADLLAAWSDLGAVDPAAFPGMLDAVLADVTVRPRYGDHPRIAILGPLEARLQQFDVTILAGLNEGTWPAVPDPDPWMSQPMRRDFGLPTADRRIGLSAHDVAMMLHADTVVLTRAVKVDGAPTRASRWLMRLDAVLAAIGEEIPRPVHRLAWVGALDRPETVRPADRPAPRPPVAIRPRTLRVTDIAWWLADPYVIYARTILGLNRLDPLDADPGAAERGMIVHAILDRVVADLAAGWPDEARETMLAAGRQAFDAVPPAQAAVWWPRFVRIADWFDREERARRALGCRPAVTESGGTLTLADGLDAPFTVRGRADRIDRLPDGGFEIIDYKTGTVPSRVQVHAGREPQLTLEALTLARGGFDGLPDGAVPTALAYWRLTGGSPPGEVKPIFSPGEGEALAHALATLVANLTALIRRYDDPATPYRAAVPATARARSDYAHLSRLDEWATAGEDR